MKPLPTRLLPLLIPGLFLAACGGEAGNAPPAGGAAGLDAPDFPLALQAPTVFQLGGFDAEGWEQFGELRAPGFDGDGNLYLLDRQASRVTVVDSTGALVRSFGRQGNGPGELASPMGMAVFPDGQVVISDLGNRGFVVFAPDGSFLRLVPFQQTQFATTIAPLPSGDVYQAGGGVRISMGGPGGPPSPPTTRPVVRYSLADASVDTLWNGWMMPPPDAPDGPAITLPGSGFTINAMPPLRAFEAPLLANPLPDGGLVVVDSVGYAVKVVRGGVLEQELGRPVLPVAVTPAIEAAEQERRLAALEDGSNQTQIRVLGPGGAGGSVDASAMERTRIEGMVFAAEIPVIAGLAVDPQGRLWVQRAGSVPGREGPTDIITLEGEYLGTIPPEGVRIPTAFGPDGLVAYLTRDEFDVSVVEVRRLPAEWVSGN